MQAKAREEWTELDLYDGQDDHQKKKTIKVTNPEFPIPDGIDVFEDFLSESQSNEILAEIANEQFTWEGFEQRRRVKRYNNLVHESIPGSLIKLYENFKVVTGLTPQQLCIEKYPKNQLSKKINASKSSVSRFETPDICKCDSMSSCSCFVAQIPISASVVAFTNRPQKRENDCWDFFSKDHWTDLMLEKNSIFVKGKDFLGYWRHRIASLSPNSEGGRDVDEVVIVKLSNTLLHHEHHSDRNASDFGYTPASANHESNSYFVGPHENTPPIEELLEIIVTTSPIKSNPSTELIEKVFETFFQGGKDFAIKCRKIIVCDGFRQRNETVSQRHSNIKQAMRSGIVDSEQAKDYERYKANLKDLCKSATSTSPFWNAEVIELESRHGYGFALKHALEHAKKKFVCVVQHDRTFMKPTPCVEILNAMVRNPRVKYVGLSMRSNLMYRDIFMSKYGKQYMDEMKELTLRLPELALDSEKYGSERLGTIIGGGDDKLQQSLRQLAETYNRSQQYSEHKKWLEQHPLDGKVQLTLLPLFFWYDNIHICETSHYRDFIFNPKYRMVKRGGFIEDKVSPVLKKTVERFGLANGHARFGCYLLDDHSGFFFTGHYDGGSYISEKDRQEMFQNASKE